MEAVKRIEGVLNVEASGDKLFIQAKDPEATNPGIVEAIVKGGGKILYVTRGAHGLEDVYLKLVGKDEAR